MFERKFAALPRYIEYRCGACKKVIYSLERPKLCPHCSTDFMKEALLTCIIDEVPIRRI